MGAFLKLYLEETINVIWQKAYSPFIKAGLGNNTRVTIKYTVTAKEGVKQEPSDTLSHTVTTCSRMDAK